MPTVTFCEKTYDCATALKGTSFIHLLDDSGTLIAAFDGITDFTGFTITDGSWTTPISDSSCYVAIVREDGTIAKGSHRCGDIINRLQFTNKTVAASAFVANSTYEDFGYRAAVALSGVTANMTPEVVFNVADAISGIFAPVAACYAGGVYIYASEKPSATITIPTIICWKAVG